ncbi:endonuclease/exonuclease/phosphatase family protein [Profundibacterium mesophilum]|uniref:Endonuclease/Exonuclease/phosphatase family domain containing protein n=1 Tax=Profundibacterium mesophilum KAUST100406-0324 TaxID=1037889 RepID=A0A921NQZ8_9RHOB|nr:endonuclease/exonuclease/phosphatase family protein [Profundibacterium mesophilum]KAF0676867.1 Endonuclease/Exonuclease/phosphatase family domain containing protein [Profundibacterium mesophilum KAUST100406-0324]
MRLLFWLLAAFFVVLTIFPLVRSARWWIRISDFPRLQIATALAILLVGYLALFGITDRWDALFLAAIVPALGLQLYRIFPYTVAAPVQVMKVSSHRPEACIRVMISNVLMENRQSDALLAVIRDVEPDLLLVVETDEWWHERLKPLDDAYPHSIKRPQDNYYGMELFSKLALDTDDVRFLLSGEIPSIRTGVRLPSGTWIDFFGVHPRPPDLDHDSEGRDAELLLVAREMRQSGRAAIVAGDMNDVAWSHTTRLFQRMSGALDPRRGRGMFTTFHAGHRLLRWPLDHIFHDNSFTLVELRRLPYIGSDHFPVLAELQYEPGTEALQEAPLADQDDHEETREMIAEGREAAGQDSRPVDPAPPNAH